MSKCQDSLPKDALFVKVTRTIARPFAKTFKYLVPVDVTHIFLGKLTCRETSKRQSRANGESALDKRATRRLTARRSMKH